MIIKRICKVCGKFFHAIPAEAKRGHATCCSIKCAHKSLTKKVERYCEVCGNIFHAVPSEIKGGFGRFCSRDCANSVVHSSSETRRKISKARKKTWRDPNYRKKMLEILRRNPSLAILNRDPNFLHKRLRGLMKRPTSLEQKLIETIRNRNLPFRYCGNGDVILGRHCPDFINYNGKKQVIEVFGRYWHDKNINPEIPWSQTADGKIDHYKKYGFSCLIIWDRELNDESAIVKKIEAFEEEAGHV